MSEFEARYYPVGRKFEAFYNPNDPSEIDLDVGFNDVALAFFAIACIYLCIVEPIAFLWVLQNSGCCKPTTRRSAKMSGAPTNTYSPALVSASVPNHGNQAPAPALIGAPPSNGNQAYFGNQAPAGLPSYTDATYPSQSAGALQNPAYPPQLYPPPAAQQPFPPQASPEQMMPRQLQRTMSASHV